MERLQQSLQTGQLPTLEELLGITFARQCLRCQLVYDALESLIGNPIEQSLHLVTKVECLLQQLLVALGINMSQSVGQGELRIQQFDIYILLAY